MRRTLVTAALMLVTATTMSACSSDEAADSSASTAGLEEALSTGDAPAQPTADVAGLPEVLATVNGEDITNAMFVETYEGQFQEASFTASQSGAPVDQDALKTQTLESMVSSLLLVQAADAAGVSVTDAQIEADIAELATSNGTPSPEEFLKLVAAQGFTEAEVREEVEKKVKIDLYVEQEGAVKEPTSADARDLYDTLATQQAQGQTSGEDAASQTLPPYETVEPEILNQLQQEAQSRAIQELLTTLREQAEITTNL